MRGNSGTNGVIPLRTILRNFLNLVENCEASAKDGLDLYEKEFQELKQFSENLKSDTAHLCKEGEKNVNRKKNRYKDILPFDYTRVILGEHGEAPGSDYINANFIKGASGSSAYIACQGPLPHTVNDFWRMVVECEVQVIVMACNEQESGKHKCENYWVEEEATEREFGQVTVWLKKCRQVCPDFLVRTMRIRYTNSKGETEERNVCQFHYSAWPDHGVPSKVSPLLDMVRLIRDCQTSETLPVLVHCSAGCGRTGTICAIDYVWGLLRLGKLTPDFSLFCLVRDMRRQRIAMVQTKDQYVLVHRAVKELFEEQLQIIDSHPYANVDKNGLPIDIKSDLEEPTYETVEFHSNDQSNGFSAISEPPSLASVKRDVAVNSKLEKEVDNYCKHQEQEIFNVKGAVASGSHSPYQKTDDIVVLSSDCDDTSEKEKEVSGEKVNPPTNTKPSRTSLLRKPSIGKLKAFFEKSKEDKKSGSTQLSRAKSDVSSRFYSFASSFNPRGHSPPMKISSPISTSACLGGESIAQEKIKSKPPLLAKPILPIKRSKSLKIGKGESFESTSGPSSSNEKGTESTVGSELSSSLSPSSSANVSSATGFSTVTNNPIKVFVKQVDIPKLQKIVSKSVKPEAQTAKTYELLQNSSQNGTDEVDSPKGHGGFEDLKSFPLKKPTVPSKAHILKDSHNFVNASHTPPKIKMGVAKEMEDTSKKNSRSSKYSKLKKYDTINPKSMAALSLGTSLTRSQSHVWQPTKVQLPVRIFSDENIHQSGSIGDRYFIESNCVSKGNRSSPYSEINDLCYEQNKLQLQSDTACRQNGGLDNTRSLIRKTSLTSKGLQSELESSLDKPTVRRRVPKTNPYANYIPSGGSPEYLSQTQSSNPRVTEVSANSEKTSQIYIGDSGGKDLPQLKISYGRSRENSSESSSNTGTPRSSLPGTPTQTMDPTYTQLIKTNLQGIGSNTKRVIGNGNGPPKSILKGSLSSTPSESDERLDSIRHGFSVQSAKPNIITAPQKISTVRIAVGNRERRNSFRQAVWKEEQPSINGGMDVQESPSNSYIFPVGSRKCTEMTNSGLIASSHKSHRDYEPIWPDSTGAGSNHFRTEPTSFHVSSEDREASKSHKPQITDRSLAFNPSNIVPGPQFPVLPMSKRSHSEERTPFGETKFQPGLQNRFDEIKVMLEELKAPNMNLSSTSNRKSPSRTSKRHDVDKIPMERPTMSSTNLKHQRSLRAPSRPQYQQGLSCFTFRKPSSFESIPDQLHAEEYQSFTSGLSPSSYEVAGNSGEKTINPIPDNLTVKGRHVNDYVSLRQCRTSSQPRDAEYFPSNENKPHGNWRQEFTSNSTPIPPPRTKKLHQNSRKESTGSNSKLGDINNPGSSSSCRAGNNVDNHQGSNNLPEIVRCANYAEDNQAGSDPQTNGNPTSPKVMVRALGMFQAKAANMRSRFANWTETKDKSNANRSNGSLLTKDNDPKDDTNNDGGFLSSVSTSATQLPCPPRSKHQYL